MPMQDGGTSLLEETARKQGESDGDQDDGTSRSDGDHLLSSSPDQVDTQHNVIVTYYRRCKSSAHHASWLQVHSCGFELQNAWLSDACIGK